ncbi:hypothetical protein [Sediminibacillus sp. JSM 1682029]|uniref:hypothetical protein n=1 Tax=Sediminibacillus sp. JSM 1682029 TaxID=3229857 RepID=UPI000423A837
MNVLLFFIGPAVVAIVWSAILSTKYKNREKIDKGFVLNYHKLTYRRKWIRSVWGVPIVVFVYLVLYWLGSLDSKEYTILGILFGVLVAADIIYNYRKWRKYERGA